jgi:hypothetical protein
MLDKPACTSAHLTITRYREVLKVASFEFLFGIAGGVKIPVGLAKRIVVGPEVYGASAFRSFMHAAETDKEWLISTRFESTGESGRQARVKLGVGGGINPQFGAPKWRVVLAVEFFGRRK